MKKATMSILASAVIATGLIAATSAFADETTTPSTDSSTNTVIVNPGDLQPMDPGNLGDMKNSIPEITNESLSNRSYSNDFNIPAGYGWVKVSLKNLGSSPITFNVRQGGINGERKMSGTVPADGKVHTFYSPHPLSTGWFNVHVDSNQAMRGTVGVRIGTSLAELKSIN